MKGIVSLLIPLYLLTANVTAKHPNDVSETCPSHIQAQIEYPLDNGDDDAHLSPPLLRKAFRRLSTVYHALTTCRNITSLDLSIAQDSSSDVVDEGPWNFEFQPHLRFSPLKELKIAGYDFDDYWKWKEDRRAAGYDKSWHWEHTWMDLLLGRGPSRQVFAEMPREPEPERYFARNLDRWMDVMDWGVLELLDVRDPGPGFLKRMAEPGRLRGVKELRFTHAGGEVLPMYWEREELGGWEELVVRFVEAVGWSVEEVGHMNLTVTTDISTNSTNSTDNSTSSTNSTTSTNSTAPPSAPPQSNLTTLSLTDVLTPSAFTTLLLPRLKPTLTSLDLRYARSNATFSAADLSTLASTLPHLATLSIDLTRNSNGIWPNTTLSALANLPQLQHLTLWQRSAPSAPRLSAARPGSDCPLSEEEIYELFTDLRARKQGVELLDLAVREADRDGQGVSCDVLESKEDGAGEERRRKREGIAWCRYLYSEGGAGGWGGATEAESWVGVGAGVGAGIGARTGGALEEVDELEGLWDRVL